MVVRKGLYNDYDKKEPIFSKNISTSLSLPVKLLVKIDTARGDVSRSRFIAKILIKDLNVVLD